MNILIPPRYNLSTQGKRKVVQNFDLRIENRLILSIQCTSHQPTAQCTHNSLRGNARVVRWGRVPCSSASQVAKQSTLNSSYLIKQSKFYLYNREQSLLYPADFGLPRVGLNFKRFHHCWTKVEDKKPAPCLTRHWPGVCWWKLATSVK